MAHAFSANDSRTTQTFRVGAEQSPVVVVDDFLGTTQALVEFAATVAQFRTPKNWYPGLRAEPLPQPYVMEAIRALHMVIGDAFGLPTNGQVDANTYFGLATLPPEALSPLQTLPHFDTANLRQIALLHYLCGEEQGGTSFYRHRATGFETVSEERQRAYYGCLDGEAAQRKTRAPRYMSGDDDLYQEIARFEAKPNRLLIYRSRSLHSANVNVRSGLSADPRKGRLTANIFLAYR